MLNQIFIKRIVAALLSLNCVALFQSPLLAADPPSGEDKTPAFAPLKEIYHDGWIDLNKNNIKDPYEDPSVNVESRIDDLLGRMTLDEKTAQMVTLYGFPRVLQDELPTKNWAAAFWKDGIGNVDEHCNGNTNFGRPIAQPVNDLPFSRHARAMNEVQRFLHRTDTAGSSR